MNKPFLPLLLLAALLCNNALASSPSAKKTIQNFYKRYLNCVHYPAITRPSTKLKYSRVFSAAIAKNRAICKKYSDGVCGWADDGDVYLNAQDYDPKLNYKNSGFKLEESPFHRVTVSFVLFPFSKEKSPRNITFKMILEQGIWVVDDIFYENEKSAQQQIDEENAYAVANPSKNGSKGKPDYLSGH
jgi:hypothetical protein